MNFIELECRVEKIKDLMTMDDCHQFNMNYIEKLDSSVIVVFTIKSRHHDININFGIIKDLEKYGLITICTDGLIRLSIVGTEIFEFIKDIKKFYITLNTRLASEEWVTKAYHDIMNDINRAIENSDKLRYLSYCVHVGLIDDLKKD